MPPRITSFLLASSIAAVALAASAGADTLVLQDGRRVHGRLVSVSRGWVEFQPLEGEEASGRLRLAVAEVESIQFDDDVGAEAPARTTFQIGGGGDRAADEVPPIGERARRRRNDSGREPSLPAREARPTGDERRRGRAVTVPTTVRWTDSGVDLAAGDVVSFSVAGTVTLGDDRPLGAEGDPDGAAAAPRRPMPDRPAGALIGRIGTSPDDTFFIGAERLPFRARTSGRLYLGLNDDTLDDDTGAFQVAIRTDKAQADQ
jgi:hypothetical protein